MKNTDKVYQSLEKQMVKYFDLKPIGVKECNEAFIALPSFGKGAIGIYSSKLEDMKIIFPKIPVRETVYKKLQIVDKEIKKIDSSFQLVVTYGFRSLEIQNKYFNKFYKKLKIKYLNEEELLEAVHRLIAVPKVSGHPTGGAVDVTILKNGKGLSMGVPIYDFSTKNIYSLSPFITKEATKNRNILRSAMMNNGFAPFDGEWWHFSYGDKEWAYYYKKESAVYEQQKVSYLLNNLNN